MALIPFIIIYDTYLLDLAAPMLYIMYPYCRCCPVDTLSLYRHCVWLNMMLNKAEWY